MSDATILSGLDAEFRGKVETLLERLRHEALAPVLTFGLRDPWTQAELWRQSRGHDEIVAKIAELREQNAPYLAQILEAVGPQAQDDWATNAVPGLSWHQWGEAVDFGWRSPTGGHVLEGDPAADGDEFEYAEDCYRRLGMVATEAGLVWGGGFTHPDENHVQKRSDGSPLETMTYAEVDARIATLWPNRP